MRWLTLLVTLFLAVAMAAAQCALCKSAVQASDNPGLIQGLRWGIGVLMALPYLVVGTIAFAIYRAYRRQTQWHWKALEN